MQINVRNETRTINVPHKQFKVMCGPVDLIDDNPIEAQSWKTNAVLSIVTSEDFQTHILPCAFRGRISY